MIQHPINKYTVLPEQETFAQDDQSENSISHHKINDEQNPKGDLVVQGEPVAIDIAEPNAQSSEFDDREIVHEYRDLFCGYRYRRIRKEKIGADGKKEDEDEVEVDQIMFAQDLPLEDMYVWTLKFNFWVSVITWPIFTFYILNTSIIPALFSEEENPAWVWLVLIFYNICMNLLVLGGTLWQRRLHRNALMNKDYKEGKRQLRGLALMPILLIVCALMIAFTSFINALTKNMENSRY